MGVFALLIPFAIKSALWLVAFRQRGEIKSYTVDSIMQYNILVMVFSALLNVFVHYEIAFEIKDGGLNRYLSKPINHTMYWFSKLLGIKIVDFFYTIVFFLIMLIPMNRYFCKFNFENICVVPFCIMLSMIINFLIYYILSLLSFKFLEISSLFTAIGFIVTFFNGEIVPLDMLPNGIEQVANYLPFKYQTFFLVKVAMGDFAGKVCYEGMVIQVVWIIMLLVISQICWKRGLQKYEAVGG